MCPQGGAAPEPAMPREVEVAQADLDLGIIQEAIAVMEVEDLRRACNYLARLTDNSDRTTPLHSDSRPELQDWVREQVKLLRQQEHLEKLRKVAVFLDDIARERYRAHLAEFRGSDRR